MLFGRAMRSASACRDVELLLAERSVVVSYETVRRRWCKNLARALPTACAIDGHGLEIKWHLDEVFIRSQVVQHYLWRTIRLNCSQPRLSAPPEPRLWVGTCRA